MKFSVLRKTNGKQHYQFTFGIPLWMIEPFTKLNYQWRKFRFWLSPFHCDVCGKRQYVRNPQYDIGHLKVENLSRGCVCRECTVKLLQGNEWEPRFSHSTKERRGSNRYNYRFWSAKKCDVTGNKVRSFKDVEIWPYIDMTFCTNAWNHSYISKEAVIDCVQNGQIRTSVWGIHKGKMVPMNTKRLFINQHGDLV